MLQRLALCFTALLASALTEQPTDQSSCNCPRLFKPVCGTDAQTYNSDCKLECAQRNIPGLRMAYEGICCPQPFCPRHWDPLCDDHGHTHENECMFRYALCVLRKTDNLVLKIASQGECKPESCEANCPKLTDPICDTSGLTHENMCMFDKANCLLRQHGQRPLLIAYKGECAITSRSPPTIARFFTTIASATVPPSPAFAISRRPIGADRIDTNAPFAAPEPKVSPSPPEQATDSPEPEPTGSSEPEPSGSASSEHSSVVSGVPEPEPPAGVSTPGAGIRPQEPQVPVDSLNSLSASPLPDRQPKAESKSTEPEQTAEPEPSKSSSNAALGGGVPEPETAPASSSEPEPEPASSLSPEPEPSASSPEPKANSGPIPSVHAQPTFNAAQSKSVELSPHDAVLGKEIFSEADAAATSSIPLNSFVSLPLPEPESEPLPATRQNETAATPTTGSAEIETSVQAVNDSYDPTLHPFDMDGREKGKASEQAIPADCTISACSVLEEPVCDNTGRTHLNKCVFESVQCIDRHRGVAEVKRIVHEGPCQVPSELHVQDGEHLEQIDAPVIQASIDAKLPLLEEGHLEEAHPRPVICSAAACTKDWNPVCDSQGKTHRNRCMFEFFACKLALKMAQEPSLAIAYESECGTQPPNHDELIFNGCPLCHPEEQVNGVPICDNANQTYPSLCIFNAHNCRQKRQNGNGAQRVLVHFGECRSTSPIFTLEQEQCPQGCSIEYKPLCDNHGTTHLNLCSFQSVNCQQRKRGLDAPYVVSLGECIQPTNEQPPQQPPLSIGHQQQTVPFPQLSFAPVKANKTQTAFPRRQLTATQFECPEPRCENERRPVCDSDGNVHRNPCIFAWARCLAAQQGKELTLAREGPCSGSCKTERTCSNTSEPVCGSDLKTYSNVCFFRQAQCENKELELLFKGKCEYCLKEACPELGADADDALFVCDSNGDTKSRCEFKMVQCIYERKSGQNISELHSGRCCDDVDLCPVTPNPVCDSRGMTVRNRCVFEVERCKIEKIQGGSLALVTEGPCEEEVKEVDYLSATDVPVVSSPPTPNARSSSASGVRRIPASSRLPVAASSLDCKAPCVDGYKPVCGSDGKTYANQCKLNAAICESDRLKLAYEGECCDIQCPTQWSPVCDANGVTHENICEFGKARCSAQRIKKQELKIASYGICQQSRCDRPCTTAYEPICGTNGRTYANKCELQKASCVAEANHKAGSPLKEDYKGECCDDEDCPYSFAPVCDSQGRTHSNKCIFKREACVAKKRTNGTLTIQYEGPCCTQPCNDDAAPVCDGNTTHKNLCLFRIKQCEAQRRGEDLSILYQGQCCAPRDATCAGTEPVCDSDGETHDNSCGFEHKRCLAMKQQRRNLTIVHEGECCAQVACKEEYKPICDSLGVTHPNMCEFDSRKCRYDKTHKNSTMQFAYKGECCDQTCESDWDPVCDQHGALYKNKCDFAVRSCEADRRSGSILLQAPCPARQARRSLRRHLKHA